MNRILLVLTVGVALLIGTAAPILADEDADAQQAANEINSEAESDSGKTAVINKLKNEFHVEESQINDLRAKKMGYGEVGIALSLAQQMPGGITNENIQKVMDLRQGERKTGWGNVAKELNLNLGKVVSQTKRMSNERQAVRNPDTNHSRVQESSAPKSQRTVSFGKPAGSVSRPMHTPSGGGKNRK